ncbi:putative N-acetyltransferase YhbS [Azospirillum fermentarium]|uniref:GNAT family N-acetyltransferase n=1 Tax=Azospirillum fermentarium TaxID=1233114 RepID=UPI0022269FA3|nr:N-acetyltransferase [Azospirillum fermentarium]MCW2247279.1 putative N-acetyltransferase YhbS [Azospirillum fermentarium]
MIITTEGPQHAAAIEALLDKAFGPGRFTKTAYRLRDGVEPVKDLCLVAIDHDEDGNETLEGTIRYWPVTIGGTTPALLLGPIAVAPHWQGGGLGSKLIRMSLNKAAAAGHRAVLLVGDAPYYNRFGFTRGLTLGMSLPGPVDLDRFLGLEMVPGALTGVTGMVGRAEAVDAGFPVPSGGLTESRPAGGLWVAMSRAAANRVVA